MTPPSVRFRGKKVYLGAVVILISAMRQGPTPRRVHELSRLFGVDRATVARWQAFWRDSIPQTPFWKLARGRVVPVVEIVVLPLSLLEAIHRTKDPCQDWGHLLRFLSPLTVPSSPLIKMTSWSTITRRGCIVTVFDQRRASSQEEILCCRRP